MPSVKLLCILFFVSTLSACSTTATLIEKRNLDVQTKMSDSIFLDPVASHKQTVFVQIRNTSDKADFDIRQALMQAVQTRGWRVVTDPDAANFMLQANILSVGMSDKTAAERALHSGYGGVLGSVALGAGVSAVTGGSGRNMGAAGLALGAVDFVGGLMVKDVYFAAITDIQLSQRARPGQKITMQSQQNLAQGNSGGDRLSYEEQVDWKRYRTRVMSSANKANLEWEDAQPELSAALVQVISGLF
tara:strand:+ start:334 stop:1071 length:738 start_codon:yes stop_codon:yes gene_type:complete